MKYFLILRLNIYSEFADLITAGKIFHDCPVSAMDSPVPDAEPETEMVVQPFAASEMGESMDADLLPELSNKTWVASELMEELTADLLLAGINVDLIVESRQDATLAMVREWIQSGATPAWAECAGFSPELRCWWLQVGNLSIDTEGRLWRRRALPAEGSELVVSRSERRAIIRRFHDFRNFPNSVASSDPGILAGITPGCSNVCCIVYGVYSKEIPMPAEGSYGTCRSRPPLGEGRHGLVGHVNHVGEGESLCVSNGGLFLSVHFLIKQRFRWQTLSPVTLCAFGMPSVIHSDQGREFENKVMHELCLLGGSHKTKTTPYHPESDGLVERFNRTLLMMLAMFAGEHKDDWDDLLPPVMMAYRSSVHESTGFSPYRLMFGEECMLPMDIGLPRRQPDLTEDISSPYAVWVKDSLEVAFDQVRRHSGQAVQ